ncbi:DUF3237 domain-containing protein [Euzebya rosea]|uniref:DUF3237 domain-containing protein n=1 Tax=Euzebya rosea TaxID=2052804 RepID=UPI000D3E3EC5|nr:DUF3237 domain-containing protein [Euzebya rosea]
MDDRATRADGRDAAVTAALQQPATPLEVAMLGHPPVLVPFTTGRITLGEAIVQTDTPRGRRVLIEMTDVVYEGPRLTGRLVGPSAVDWLLEGPDGSAHIDVQFTIRTHDDALVFVRYYGRADHSGGVGTSPLYSAPVFETGDPRYLWLNKVLTVGRAVVDAGVIRYDIYEVV